MTAKMQGIVLAAGRGTRLSAISDGVPKLLLEIGGKTLIEHLTLQLLDAGIDDVIVITREGTTDDFRKVFDDGIGLDLKRVSFVEVPLSNNNILDTMYSVRNHINCDKLLYSCDVLLEDSLRPAVNAFKAQRNGARTVSSYMDDTAGFSHIAVQNSAITKFHRKDKERHVSGLIDLGFWMFHSDVFSVMEEFLSLDESMGIFELNKHFVNLGLHHHTQAKGWWSDVGNSCAEFIKVREKFLGECVE